MEDQIGGACDMHMSKESYEVMVMKSECKTPLKRPKIVGG
jgi:hypothetical protein